MDAATNKIPISVALSGSGFKFPTHIGVLQAILDNGYEIVEIAGVSGGSIVAACFAQGMSPRQMMNMAHTAPFTSFIKLDLAVVLLNQALNTGNDLLQWLKNAVGVKTIFKDIKLPLCIIATDLNSDGPVIFSQSTTPDFSVAEACRCSASIPIVFEAIQFDDKYLVDGGICNDLPVNYLTPANKKFAVELLEETKPLSGRVSVLSIIGRILDTLMISTENIEIIGSQDCTVIKVITPPGLTLDTSMTSEQIDQLYTLGYNTADAIIKKAS